MRRRAIGLVERSRCEVHRGAQRLGRRETAHPFSGALDVERERTEGVECCCDVRPEVVPHLAGEGGMQQLLRPPGLARDGDGGAAR